MGQFTKFLICLCYLHLSVVAQANELPREQALQATLAADPTDSLRWRALADWLKEQGRPEAQAVLYLSEFFARRYVPTMVFKPDHMFSHPFEVSPLEFKSYMDSRLFYTRYNDDRIIALQKKIQSAAGQKSINKRNILVHGLPFYLHIDNPAKFRSMLPQFMQLYPGIQHVEFAANGSPDEIASVLALPEMQHISVLTLTTSQIRDRVFAKGPRNLRVLMVDEVWVNSGRSVEEPLTAERIGNLLNTPLLPMLEGLSFSTLPSLGILAEALQHTTSSKKLLVDVKNLIDLSFDWRDFHSIQNAKLKAFGVDSPVAPSNPQDAFSGNVWSELTHLSWHSVRDRFFIPQIAKLPLEGLYLENLGGFPVSGIGDGVAAQSLRGLSFNDRIADAYLVRILEHQNLRLRYLGLPQTNFIFTKTKRIIPAILRSPYVGGLHSLVSSTDPKALMEALTEAKGNECQFGIEAYSDHVFRRQIDEF